MEKHQVETVGIIQIDYYFVYLPFYYAASNNFWSSKLGNYQFDYISPRSTKTDKDVIKRLMDSNSPGIAFAIADPTSIFEYQAEQGGRSEDIVVLAALLTNAAFWAVDHDNHIVENLQDLNRFDKIYAYGEGTTSHRIARTISTQKIESLIPKTEIEVLTQGEKGESFVVLTPDLVGLESILFENSNEYRVKLDIGSTTEFNEVLITALITRRDVVNHHQTLVEEVLKGIQRACYLVQIDDEGVVKFADKFSSLHPLEQKNPKTEEILKNALYRANRCRVFPLAITITQAQWERSARTFWQAKGEEFTQKAENINIIYENNIKPYCDYSQNATKIVLKNISSQPNLPIFLSRWRLLFSKMSNLPNNLKYLAILVGLVILAIPLIRGSYSVMVDLKNLVVTMNPPNPSPSPTITPTLSPSSNSPNIPSSPIKETVSFIMKIQWEDSGKTIDGASITFVDGAKTLNEASTKSLSNGSISPVFLPRKNLICVINHKDFKQPFSFPLILASSTKEDYEIPLQPIPQEIRKNK
jgi:hypothetical protein